MEPTGPDPELPDSQQTPDGGRDDDEPRTLDDWVHAALRESLFWPVAVVMALVAFTVGGAILVFALYVRNLGGIAALAILVLMSVNAVRQDVRARGFGWISRGIVGIWVGSAVAALAAGFLGLLELS